jgi:hypothetical protein
VGELADAIRFITEVKSSTPRADKAEIQQAYVERFSPQRRRSLFIGQGYSMRFSETQGSSFSNTVLSLSALREVDDCEMVVCVVGPISVRFLLANSTFLSKISHSSHRLRIDNVKGSFNGTDILTNYEGVANQPETFEQLFAMHAAFTWAENLERLVEATTAIVARNLRFDPTAEQRAVILAAPERAAAALSSTRFTEAENELRAIVLQGEAEIVLAAAVENVNLRGNRIERLVTGGATVHELGDLRRAFGGGELVVDVKTKLLDRVSAPKAYNIDKMLAFLAKEGSVFAFLVLGVDVRAATVVARLVPVLDQILLAATAVQHHWAGRGSRGVTQLSGRFDRVLASDYGPEIDIVKANAFILELLAR